MVPLTHVPRPPLCHFVEVLWRYESFNVPHARERLLPDGSTELVIDLGNEAIRMAAGRQGDELQSFHGGVLIGVQSEPFLMDTSSPSRVIGVHFKSGGSFPFLAPPAGELKGRVVAIDALWGVDAHALRERLLGAADAGAQFRILEEFLLVQATRPLQWHPAVAFALREFRDAPRRTVSDVSFRTGYSRKQFIQLFRDQVGLTPKLHCRLRRFQEVLRRVKTQTDIDWADIALDCGYYDQAHFIHDFRAFSGLSPTAYVSARTERLNHVPLRD